LTNKSWSNLGDQQKTVVLVAVSVQFSLQLTALTDFYWRSAGEIKGGKR
jgi:hypothetical protein